MKIKSDFITNSSSTSFLLISKDSLKKEDFLRLVGVKKESDFVPMFEHLYSALTDNLTPAEEYFQSSRKCEKYKNFEEYITEEFGKDVLERCIKAKIEGKNVFIGGLSSDTDTIECLFCCDSFLMEDKQLYINGINSTW